MSKKNSVCLDDLLCFTVYSTNNLINRLYMPHLKSMGLTYPQYLVMVVLWQQGSPMLVGDIGSKLFLETNTLTPLLKRIEGLGLISRTRSKEDERQVLISLTKKGRDKQRQAHCIPEAIIEASGSGVEELMDLNARIKKLQVLLIT